MKKLELPKVTLLARGLGLDLKKLPPGRGCKHASVLPFPQPLAFLGFLLTLVDVPRGWRPNKSRGN